MDLSLISMDMEVSTFKNGSDVNSYEGARVLNLKQSVQQRSSLFTQSGEVTCSAHRKVKLFSIRRHILPFLGRLQHTVSRAAVVVFFVVVVFLHF